MTYMVIFFPCPANLVHLLGLDRQQMHVRGRSVDHRSEEYSSKPNNSSIASPKNEILMSANGNHES